MGSGGPGVGGGQVCSGREMEVYRTSFNFILHFNTSVKVGSKSLLPADNKEKPRPRLHLRGWLLVFVWLQREASGEFNDETVEREGFYLMNYNKYI